VRVVPEGPIPADLMILGGSPHFEEESGGRMFIGKGGRELWAGMQRFCGLTREQFYLTHVIKDGLGKKKPKPVQIAEGVCDLLDEIQAVRPRILIAAGSMAARVILGDVSLNNVHGIPHTSDIAGHQFTCYPVYDPKAGLANKGFLSGFAYDLKRLAALLRGELPAWAPGSPTSTSWLLGQPRQDFGADTTVVAVDTEGWPEKPWGLSFCFDGQHGYVIGGPQPESVYALAWFKRWVAGKTVVMHNGLHDIPVLRAMGVYLGDYHDTQVLGYHDMLRTGSGVLDAEAQNLGTLAYRECGMVLGELSDIRGVSFGTQTIPYSDAVMEYAGLDPIATWRLFNIYEQRGLLNYLPYQIDMGQVPLVGQMVANGLPFDADATLDYYAEVLDKIDEVTADLRSRAARLGNRDFNPGSHPQVRELVTRRLSLRVRKRTRGGLASTNEKALADHQGHPFIKALQTHRELSKLRGTYLKPLLQELQ
jgi:uracil-DNA glycosylase family 4